MSEPTLSLAQMPHIYRCGAFDCGVSGINIALARELPQAIREGRSRAYVVEDGAGCLGFIALRAESFELADSIDREQYSVSARTVPGVLLELLAVDKRAQGKGLGKELFLAAALLAGQVADVIGARFLVLDSLPERVKFYEAQGCTRAKGQARSDTVFMVFDLLQPSPPDMPRV